MKKPSSITWDGTVLTSTPGYRYQWYFEGNPLYNAQQQSLRATLQRTYTVTVTDTNGCSATSEPFTLVLTGVEDLRPDARVRLYPNPAGERVTVEVRMAGLAGECTVEIRDIPGRPVLPHVMALQAGYGREVLTLEALPPALYLLTIRSGSDTIVQNFVKE